MAKPTTSSFPTHAQLTSFISSLLPLRPKDVPLLYHVPRFAAYDPMNFPISHIVLSITPTPSVYTLLNRRALPYPAACFLHRPFTLDRRHLRRSTLVLSSHVGFDEVLTVGWNLALATRLGMDVEESACVQGYKGDAERRIGVVGRVEATLGTLLQRIRSEFAGVGEAFGEEGVEDIQAMAIMNAFHQEEVDRVLRAAEEKSWITSEEGGKRVLYLTGQPREYGLNAAREVGMPVVCVGHGPAEEWGIRYLAQRLRAEFPDLSVDEVYEEEVVPERPPKM